MVLILAAAFFLQPDPAMLRQLFEESLTQERSAYGEFDLRTAQAARDLGLFLIRQGDSTGARRALTDAVRIDARVAGPAAERTLADVAELASVSSPGDAEPLWRQASASSDPAVAARAFAALGALREQSGDRIEAAKLYRKALVKEELASGHEGARIAARLNTLALFVEAPEAIALLERALRISTIKLGASRLETASIQLNLASALLKAGRLQQAERVAAEAAAVFRNLLGAAHPRTALAELLHNRAIENGQGPAPIGTRGSVGE